MTKNNLFGNKSLEQIEKEDDFAEQSAALFPKLVDLVFNKNCIVISHAIGLLLGHIEASCENPSLSDSMIEKIKDIADGYRKHLDQKNKCLKNVKYDA